jgi:hypothetical protein
MLIPFFFFFFFFFYYYCASASGRNVDGNGIVSSELSV